MSRETDIKLLMDNWEEKHKNNGYKRFIRDGIVCEEKWEAQHTPRVCYFLKEAYTSNENGYNLVEDLHDCERPWTMWRKVAILKDLFEKLGFQRKDLKTVYFNVDTEYESYQDRDKSWKRRFKGYKYNHHMKIEFAADNKRLGQVLYALAHSSLRPEFSIEYTVADVEKCKNELLHKAIEDSIQKAQVLTTAANVKLGEIQAIDYSWGEIDFVTKPLNEMRLMECTECEMSAPGAYDIDIEADDINVTDTATVIWEIA